MGGLDQQQRRLRRDDRERLQIWVGQTEQPHIAVKHFSHAGGGWLLSLPGERQLRDPSHADRNHGAHQRLEGGWSFLGCRALEPAAAGFPNGRPWTARKRVLEFIFLPFL